VRVRTERIRRALFPPRLLRRVGSKLKVHASHIAFMVFVSSEGPEWNLPANELQPCFICDALSALGGIFFRAELRQSREKRAL